MNPAIQRMLERYELDTMDQYVNALREILQQLALLGLWRSKFFEKAAFYGGTALRLLYGLDRYSEDLDFSLLRAEPGFSLDRYGIALRDEMASFGFMVSFEPKTKVRKSTIDSAFIKANTMQQIVAIEADDEIQKSLSPTRKLKIRLEVDVDPPGGFATETSPILQPIPFAIRVYSRSDLFAGKMHALLCRKWGNRVKGRDWYDFVWYVANAPQLHLSHLEQRMRYSDHYKDEGALTPVGLKQLFCTCVEALDVDKARDEVEPFLRQPGSTQIWSTEFFLALFDRIEFT